MSKVRYYLQSPKSERTRIRLTFHYGRRRLVYYTGDVIEAKHWNPQTERMRKSAPGHLEINTGLDRLESITLEIFRTYRNDGKPLPLDLFRQEIDAAWKGKIAARPTALSLFELWGEKIAEMRTSPQYAPATAKAHQTALNRVVEFSRATKRLVDFDSVDLEFHSALMRFLGAKGYSPNFIHKIVSLLKTIVQEGVDRGLHSNMLFRSPKFTVKRYEPEHVYLNEEELGRISALDLSKKARLDKVRDLFLIGCYTGLRFSDYSRLKPENLATFDGVLVLTIEARKTKKRVYVPILAPVKAILEKHGGIPPAGISNQKMNTYLKELARLAGIVDQIQVNSVRGAQRVQAVVEKCDLISTHTARRSFASNEYLRAVKDGRSFRPIMDILGMTKEATFLRYVKVDRLAALVDWVRGR